MRVDVSNALSPTCADCMSRDVVVIEPRRPLMEAARLMRELDVGAIPVCQGSLALAGLAGMITDRDIVVRVIAEDLDCERVEVGEVMSSPVIYCFEDESPWQALHLMEQHGVRRLPVVARHEKSIVGLVSMSDLSQIEVIDHMPQKWSERVVQVIAAHQRWRML
ncbi:MAG: hypothetical protein RJB38_1022 [Pseudomonadota bacterium]|jgi:CBS domain-containing protein